MIPWHWDDFAIISVVTYQTDYTVFNQQRLILSRRNVLKVIHVEPSLMWNIGFRWGSVFGRLNHASGSIPLEQLPLESAPPPNFLTTDCRPMVWILHQNFKTLKFIIIFHQQNNLVALQILRFGIIFRKASKRTMLTKSKPCVIMFRIV